MCMLENLIKGAMAGLAGTTALNAATYLDMVWRGRPASSTPEQVVEELAKRSGRAIPATASSARTACRRWVRWPESRAEWRLARRPGSSMA